MWRKRFFAIGFGLVVPLLVFFTVDLIYMAVHFFSQTSLQHYDIGTTFLTSHRLTSPPKFALKQSLSEWAGPELNWDSVRKDKQTLVEKFDNFQASYLNGIVLNPQGKWRHQVTVAETGETVYDVEYEFDQYGRRVVASPDQAGRPLHFLLMGCSQALGQGSPPEGTIAAQFAEMNPDYAPDILAQFAGNPAQILALIRLQHGLDGIPQKKGIAIFRLQEFHFGRLVRRAFEAKDRAYARYDENGKIDVSTSLENARPFYLSGLHYLERSMLHQVFKLDYPLWFGDYTMRLMADTLEAIRDEYHRKTSSENPFVVVFMNWRDGAIQPFLPYLEERGIQYLDYTGINETRLVSEYPFFHNNRELHPKPVLNRVYAKALTKDLAPLKPAH